MKKGLNSQLRPYHKEIRILLNLCMTILTQNPILSSQKALEELGRACCIV